MKNKLFYKDEKENICKSYQDLIDNLNEQSIYSKYCRKESYYEIFEQLILSLILDEEIVLLDADLSEDEVKVLIGDDWKETEYAIITHLPKGQITFNILRESLSRKNSKWKVTLFTSGTTGLPKKVSHSLISISRFVKLSPRHKDDIWGFAYNPTHIAGLQVFFQALLNFNSIIRLFGMQREEILRLIAENKITNISATPTFYRLLLPSNQKLESVRRVTSGGEKFDSRTMDSLQKMFVNAQFTNIYASTEAGSLFATREGDTFILKEDLRGLIKIEGNELFLHRTLMGDSEKIKFENDWYPTGDLITIISQTPFTFKFVSRKNEMINVGGYKVNPIEVEEVIRSYPTIEDAFVFAKKNRILGNLICAEIICRTEGITEKDIRKYLSGKLQEFKIPRIITFVKQLNVTRTGKTSRNRK